jgi:hypothetical protein
MNDEREFLWELDDEHELLAKLGSVLGLVATGLVVTGGLVSIASFNSWLWILGAISSTAPFIFLSVAGLIARLSHLEEEDRYLSIGRGGNVPEWRSVGIGVLLSIALYVLFAVGITSFATMIGLPHYEFKHMFTVPIGFNSDEELIAPEGFLNKNEIEIVHFVTEFGEGKSCDEELELPNLSQDICETAQYLFEKCGPDFDCIRKSELTLDRAGWQFVFRAYSDRQEAKFKQNALRQKALVEQLCKNPKSPELKVKFLSIGQDRVAHDPDYTQELMDAEIDRLNTMNCVQ